MRFVWADGSSKLAYQVDDQISGIKTVQILLNGKEDSSWPTDCRAFM